MLFLVGFAGAILNNYNSRKEQFQCQAFGWKLLQSFGWFSVIES
jgi:hypothetical protein